MHILNVEAMPEDRVYRCGRILASYLIYQKKLPLLSENGKDWYFAVTDDLKKALEETPFWMKISCKF